MLLFVYDLYETSIDALGKKIVESFFRSLHMIDFSSTTLINMLRYWSLALNSPITKFIRAIESQSQDPSRTISLYYLRTILSTPCSLEHSIPQTKTDSLFHKKEAFYKSKHNPLCMGGDALFEVPQDTAYLSITTIQTLAKLFT